VTSKNPLECWRVENSLSVIAVSRLLFVSRKTWYEWIGGRSIPSDRTATLILAQTGVTRSQLMAWKEAQVPEKVAS
jgi:hypothetical protein